MSTLDGSFWGHARPAFLGCWGPFRVLSSSAPARSQAPWFQESRTGCGQAPPLTDWLQTGHPLLEPGFPAASLGGKGGQRRQTGGFEALHGEALVLFFLWRGLGKRLYFQPAPHLPRKAVVGSGGASGGADSPPPRSPQEPRGEGTRACPVGRCKHWAVSQHAHLLSPLPSLV